MFHVKHRKRNGFWLAVNALASRNWFACGFFSSFCEHRDEAVFSIRAKPTLAAGGLLVFSWLPGWGTASLYLQPICRKLVVLTLEEQYTFLDVASGMELP